MKITQKALDKKLLDIRGEEFPVPYPTDSEKAKLPEDKDGKPDFTKLPTATVRDLILDCLVVHEADTRKEGFYTNVIVQSVLGKDDFELKDKVIAFLKLALEGGILRTEIEKKKLPDGKEIDNPVPKGLYKSFLIDQAMDHLGYEL